MRKPSFISGTAVSGLLALLGVLTAAGAAEAQAWGTVKGQVVWAGPLPVPEKVKVTNDPKHCLSKGPLFHDNKVVNPKNKGVRWAMVWLVDAGDPDKALPIHPALRKLAKAKVEMDQPCCMFEPHVVGLRIGQALEVNNSSPVSHNVNVRSEPGPGPNKNPILPPGKSLSLGAAEFQPRAMPIQISCNIHGWMKASVFVFNHPYFAVTDENGNFEIKNAPAGKYRLVAWHEEVGFLDGTIPRKGSGGKLIEIKNVTDVGKLEVKPEPE
jgi:hypothetical protein